MKKLLALSISAILLILSAIPAIASTFTFGNSEYILVQTSGISWDEARIAAEAAGGHLATITSIEENNFFKSNVFKDANKAYWLGAYQTGDEDRQNPTANWQWITGEEWTYTDWSSVEPNNAGMDEAHLSADSRYQFSWNDEDSAVQRMINGYVVEKQLPPTPTPIPGTIWLLGVSLITVSGLRHRFNK
ncbi:lectin-like protein [Maridesulfovibrio hydrothermalis]|uniref:C-type lectin domain protein n=1 Tax=Maridesulfovibrio hydrothermalis AM13 = DSM 14728 TaxID=1121451 RepID=L0REH9_9BACT|nr:lectin-like protein [Maridesulfovibrio hydrothermalis]CCO24617.1 C-type lectin domain protein [Maridesulfovibrio hydrothermalis AM13 = DSM 14728]